MNGHVHGYSTQLNHHGLDSCKTVRKGNHHGASSIIFMPMIDKKSTDSVCLLSTISFVCTLSQKYAMTPILTFDQPLYWKAMELMVSHPDDHLVKKCVLRLGGLNMCMSFLG